MAYTLGDTTLVRLHNSDGTTSYFSRDTVTGIDTPITQEEAGVAIIDGVKVATSATWTPPAGSISGPDGRLYTPLIDSNKVAHSPIQCGDGSVKYGPPFDRGCGAVSSLTNTSLINPNLDGGFSLTTILLLGGGALALLLLLKKKKTSV